MPPFSILASETVLAGSCPNGECRLTGRNGLALVKVAGRMDGNSFTGAYQIIYESKERMSTAGTLLLEAAPADGAPAGAGSSLAAGAFGGGLSGNDPYARPGAPLTGSAPPVPIRQHSLEKGALPDIQGKWTIAEVGPYTQHPGNGREFVVTGVTRSGEAGWDGTFLLEWPGATESVTGRYLMVNNMFEFMAPRFVNGKQVTARYVASLRPPCEFSGSAKQHPPSTTESSPLWFFTFRRTGDPRCGAK